MNYSIFPIVAIHCGDWRFLSNEEVPSDEVLAKFEQRDPASVEDFVSFCLDLQNRWIGRLYWNIDQRATCESHTNPDQPLPRDTMMYVEGEGHVLFKNL